METTKPLGLRQRILMAKTETELDALLAEGKTYDHPSPGTVRRWHRAAKARLEALKNPRPDVAQKPTLTNSQKRRVNVEAGRHPSAGITEGK